MLYKLKHFFTKTPLIIIFPVMVISSFKLHSNQQQQKFEHITMTNWLLMILSYVFIKRHIIASNVFTGFTFELYSIRNNMFMILQKTCKCFLAYVAL